MQVDPEAGRMIEDELRVHGLDVKLGVDAVAFEGRNKVAVAHLSDESQVACDLVVIGKGVFPAHAYVPKEKIAIDAGIRVDDYMQTSIPEVFAAGDVAEHRDIARKVPWVNAIWPEAAVQGRIAGLNMAGQSAVCKGSLSRNVIRIFNLDVMTAGMVNPGDSDGCHVISRRDARDDTYRKLVFKGDRLVGMVMVNRIEQGGVLMSLIQSESPILLPLGALLKPGFNFSQLLKVG
jgi:NAD(P)H-nitrite reductase large subunit